MAGVGFSVLMFQKIMPAFSEIGYGDPFERVMLIFSLLVAAMLIFVVLTSATVWRAVVADQRLNDEAGYNVVGERERAAFVRYEAALKRLKARKRQHYY